jgi:hypothetical protein
MKKLILLLLIAFTCSCIIAPAPSTTFQGRMGKHISVKINDVETSNIKTTEIRDLNGYREAEANWRVVQNTGKLCIEVSALTEEFGEFVNANLIITKINPELPQARWRNYMTDFDAVVSFPAKSVFVPNKKICNETFYLSSRLHYKELPKGDYVLKVTYNARNNWDRQEILLTIN